MTRVVDTANTLVSNVIERMSGFAVVSCSPKNLKLRFQIKGVGLKYMVKVGTLCDSLQSI
jgi:hypothetical protein